MSATAYRVMGPPNHAPGVNIMGDPNRSFQLYLMGGADPGPRVDLLSGPNVGPHVDIMGKSNPKLVDALFTGSTRERRDGRVAPPTTGLAWAGA